MPPNPDLDHDLIKRYIDGTLDDVGFSELQRRLRMNRETRELLWVWTRMEMGLRDASLIANEKAEPIIANKRPQDRIINWRVMWLFAATFTAITIIALLTRTPSEKAQKLPAQYVATIIRSQSAIWENDTYHEGQRLYVGSLAVRSGTVQINCDRGATLEIEGPTAIDLTSSASVLLTRGVLTLRNANHMEPFQTITPKAYLDDVGAEYSVSLTDHGEVITVYSGELWRTDKLDRDKVTIIEQGQEWRVNNGKEELAAFSLVASKTIQGETIKPVNQPLAWQSFRGISEKELLVASSSNGPMKSGGWWKNGWSIHHHTEVFPGETILQYNDQGVNVIGDAGFTNGLKNPIRLNDAQQIYIAIRFKPPKDANYSVVLVMRGEGIMRQGVIVKNSKLITIESEEKRALKPISPFAEEAAVLLVKISSSKSQPDQLMACVFTQAALPLLEPTQWHQYGPLFSLDLPIERISCRVMSKLAMGLSDIRVGASWASVIPP